MDPKQVEANAAAPPPPSYTEATGVANTPSPGYRISRVDFWPNILSGSTGIFSRPTYEDFGQVMARANQWLASNPTVEIINCESAEMKIQSGGQVNPENTTFSESEHSYYLRGLRLWIRPRSEPGPPIQLGYFNTVPGMLSKPGFLKMPVFENFTTIIANLNNMFKEKPLPGKIITVETQDMKLDTGFLGSNMSINPDQSSWGSFGSHIYLFILRIFYICGPPAYEEIGFADFVPACLGEASMFSLPSFAPYSSVIPQAQQWIKQYHGSIRTINTQTIDYKLQRGSAFSGNVVIDPMMTWYYEESSSMGTGHRRRNRQSYTYFVRGLRVVYAKKVDGTQYPPSQPINITERVFYPVQLTNGEWLSPPSFEGLQQTLGRADAWLKHINAGILSVETLPVRLSSSPNMSMLGADASLVLETGYMYTQYVVRVFLNDFFQEPPAEVLPPVPAGITHWTQSGSAVQKCTIQ